MSMSETRISKKISNFAADLPKTGRKEARTGADLHEV